MVWILIAHIMIGDRDMGLIGSNFHTAYASPDGCTSIAVQYNKTKEGIFWECRQFEIKK